MSKPRLLYICGHAPWPRNGGALLRNYWMIAALSRQYAVDLVTADATSPVPGDFAAMIDDYAAFPRSASSRGGVGRIARAALPSGSSLTAGWTNSALRDHVAERLGRFPYAAIQLDLAMHAALPRRDAIPIVYNAHNCESTFLTRRAKTEQPYLAPILTIDALKVRAIERSLVNRSTLVTACAEDDVCDFERFVPAVRKKVAIVPNGVDLASYESVRQTTPREHTILISGSMDWRPNQAGLRWFLHDVLPRLRSAIPNIVVRIAGRMQPALVEELRAYPNVQAYPNPVSMLEHLAAAVAVAAPIVVSSGTRLRILEAWAAGRPVITTTAGAFGLDHEDRRDMLVRDDAAEFAEGIVKIVATESLRDWLVYNAARRVERYDWEVIGEGLRNAYTRHIGHAAARVPVISEEISVGARS
jgi:glycosyltransferase involved in cell wall biosynthesis